MLHVVVKPKQFTSSFAFCREAIQRILLGRFSFGHRPFTGVWNINLSVHYAFEAAAKFTHQPATSSLRVFRGKPSIRF